MPNLSKPATRLTALAGAFALVGCASVADVKPGTSYAEVVKQFGQPAVTCPEPSGGTRAIWTQQPSGEYAWAITVDDNKQVTSVRQVLDQEAFNVLRNKEWDTHSVKCEFGPPAKVQIFPENPDEVTWEYRFYGVGFEYMMLFAYFDRASSRLVKFNIGMDPELNLSLVGGR